MKFVVAFLAALCVLNSTDWVSGKNSSVEIKWMDLKLDHLDKNNHSVWKMRYMVNEKYFITGGPMFIYLGGEQSIAASFLEWGLLVDIAIHHKGILFYPEHRFYGESKVGTSLSMDTLKFLDSRQALADFANFISTQRHTDRRLANSKVIVVGCSYAGTLAVGLSRWYPKLVTGVWAISAPILAQAEYPQYLEITGEAIRVLGSPQCYDRIQSGIKEVENMFFNGRANDAKTMLKLCDNVNIASLKDIWALFRAIQKLFTELVTRQSLVSRDVANACDFLMERSNDLTAVVEYFLGHFKPTGSKGCNEPNYLGTVFHHSNTSYNNTVSRQWMYQTCNEFGWFQGTASERQPFGSSSPMDLDWAYCRDIFGSEFTETRIRQKIAETNQFFGGLNHGVKNVYMTYGSLDPWVALGPGNSDISTVVPLYSHCAHVESIQYLTDTPEMIASKQRIMEKVQEWLA